MGDINPSLTSDHSPRTLHSFDTGFIADTFLPKFRCPENLLEIHTETSQALFTPGRK